MRQHADAVAVMPREIGLDEMVGDDGGLGLRAAPRLEQARRQVAQLLMIDVHGLQRVAKRTRASSA